MGNSQYTQKINFEDIQYIFKSNNSYLIINTLPLNEQDCLITNTIPASQEEVIINNLLKKGQKNIHIVIYGKNCNDDTIYTKYKQLVKLGFTNLYLYIGGMFEWLILQDIYGIDDFPSTIKLIDFLKYKPKQILNISLIDYK